MAFDYKKECKELYQPKRTPSIVRVPPMSFIAVRGRGDPNAAGGEYQVAVELLYGVAYAIKMSKKGPRGIEGYFDFVVPPLEGFWRQEGARGFDRGRKDALEWTSVIRMPDFVGEADVAWAVGEAGRKKKGDFSKVELMTVDEGLCVQALHVGPFDDEPATVAAMDRFLAASGYASDFSDGRAHHEIYLSDPRRVAPERLKTVIRHPVRKA